MALSHRELCEIGANWLRSSNYHNCKSILIDGGSFEERPDVIGFRYRRPPYGSVLLEAKISKSDFLNDKTKPHRQDGKGMGKWRYYICPKGLILPEEIPPLWGLLYVSDAGRVKVIKGVFETKNTGREISEAYEKFQFPKYDLELESRLLAVNLQAMLYNEEEGLDLKELKKQRDKYLNKDMESTKEITDLKRKLSIAQQNENFYKKQLEMQKTMVAVKNGKIQTLRQDIDVITGNIEI
ncbi:hypothetical protein ACQWTT_001197 [Acinetobacter baumannii]